MKFNSAFIAVAQLLAFAVANPLPGSDIVCPKDNPFCGLGPQPSGIIIGREPASDVIVSCGGMRCDTTTSVCCGPKGCYPKAQGCPKEKRTPFPEPASDVIVSCGGERCDTTTSVCCGPKGCFPKEQGCPKERRAPLPEPASDVIISCGGERCDTTTSVCCGARGCFSKLTGCPKEKKSLVSCSVTGCLADQQCCGPVGAETCRPKGHVCPL